MIDQAERERLEVDFWANDPIECPGSDNIESILLKAQEATMFYVLFNQYRADFASGGTILELGGGHCWASCIVKRLVPSAHMIASDISPHAVASNPKWHGVFGGAPDEIFSCKSYDIPLADSSVDTVFVYAAAHHFGRHRATLVELRRVLRPGGKALYLYEPATSDLMYARAVARATAFRPVVREDVLRWRELLSIAESVGLSARVDFNVNPRNPSIFKAGYYAALRAVPVLRKWMPCSANFVFLKSR